MAQTKITKNEIETQESWQTPTLQNSWVNWGSNYMVASYMKDSLGFVHLQGLIKNGTLNSIIMTLPAGYRPLSDLRFVVECSGVVGSVSLSSAGVVTQTLGNNTFLNLSGIVYKAEQ